MDYTKNPVLLANHNPDTAEVVAHIDFDALIIWEWIIAKEYKMTTQQYDDSRKEMLEKSKMLAMWLHDIWKIFWYWLELRCAVMRNPNTEMMTVSFLVRRI